MLHRTALALGAAPLLGALTFASWRTPAPTAPSDARRAPSAAQDDDDDDDDEGDEAEERELDLRDLAGKAKLDLAAAIQKALAVQAGSPVEAGLEGEVDDGEVHVFYEVMIVGEDHELHEVQVSHLDGHVLSNAVEDDAEERAELAEFERALRQCEHPLSELANAARGLVTGEVLSASLEFEHGGPVCDVRVVNGRYLVEVEVEGRAGRIVGLELADAEDEGEADRPARRDRHEGDYDEDDDDGDDD